MTTFVLVFSVFVPLAVGLLTNELSALLPWLTRKVVGLAARIDADHPDEVSDIYGEHMDGISALPGHLCGLLAALGLLFKMAITRRVRDGALAIWCRMQVRVGLARTAIARHRTPPIHPASTSFTEATQLSSLGQQTPRITVEAELCNDDDRTPAQQPMAENVARRRADREIITELKAHNFEGPLYDYFAAELAAYALAMLMAWMRTGEIFRKCREEGRPVPLAEIWKWDRDDRLELAHLTVAKALAVFRERVLVPGVWNPRRGATIESCFVGVCLLQFGNFFFEFANERRKWVGSALLDDVHDASADPLAEDPAERDPAVIVIQRDQIKQAINTMPSDLIKAVTMIYYEGYTYQDAAAEIGTNAEALGARIRRFRNRHRGNEAAMT